MHKMLYPNFIKINTPGQKGTETSDTTTMRNFNIPLSIEIECSVQETYRAASGRQQGVIKSLQLSNTSPNQLYF